MKVGALRVSVGLADQALASGSSFLLAIVVARHATPPEFGAFALTWTVYWICLGLTRSLVCEPLLIRYAGLEGARWRLVTSRAAGAALCLGTCFGMACAAAGVLLGARLGTWLLVLSVLLPGLLVQDVWRAAFFARAAPQRALLNDVSWLIMFAAAALLVEAGLLGGTLAPMAAWGAAGCAAALIGAWQARARPAVRSPLRWWRRTRPLAGRLAAEFMTLGLAGQLATYAVAAIAGLTAAGALRGAQTLLGVMNVLFAGLLFTLVPHGVGLARCSPRAVIRLSKRVAAACASAALALGIGLSLLPDAVGAALLGTIWPTTEEILIPLAVAFAFAGVVFGAITGLRSLADTRRSLHARLVAAPITVVGAAAGAFVGVREAAVGIATAGLVAAVVWWRSLESAVGALEHSATARPPSARSHGSPGLDRGARPHVATAD
jgi:hypothetical protein